jgi:hypothetical protein
VRVIVGARSHGRRSRRGQNSVAESAVVAWCSDACAVASPVAVSFEDEELGERDKLLAIR